jgi:hypothetical protein
MFEVMFKMFLCSKQKSLKPLVTAPATNVKHAVLSHWIYRFVLC